MVRADEEQIFVLIVIQLTFSVTPSPPAEKPHFSSLTDRISTQSLTTGRMIPSTIFLAKRF